MPRGHSAQKTTLRVPQSSVRSIGELQTLETCNLSSFRKFQNQTKDGAFVIVTLKECDSCQPTKDFLKKKVKGKIPILEIKAERAACLDLAISELNVRDTPTVLFMQKGKQNRKLAGPGKSIEASEAIIDRILSKR